MGVTDRTPLTATELSRSFDPAPTDDPVDLIRRLLYNCYSIPKGEPNFQLTPERFAKYLDEHFFGDPAKTLSTLKGSVFPTAYEGLIAETEIAVDGMCPHHLLPISYTMAIGYLADGKVLGLSKLVRLARAYGSKPLLQEDVTELIADGLESLLNTRGVGVVIEGRHSCMAIRGVKSAPKVTTSTVRGLLRESPSAKEEFLMLVRR